MEEDNQATSHKGERIRSHTLQFRLDAVSFAHIHGNRAAEWNFTVHNFTEKNTRIGGGEKVLKKL